MFGHHVHADDAPGTPLAGRLAAARAAVDSEWGAGIFGAAQVFIAGPRTFRSTLPKTAEAATKEYVERTGLVLLVHGAYPDVYWSPKAPTAARAHTHIRTELAACARIGARGLVVHLPQNTVTVAMSGLRGLLAPESRAPAPPGTPNAPYLYLENPGFGKATAERGFETPAKLGALLAAARRELPPAEYARIGLCIDTAHLWSSGIDLRTRAAAKAWLAEFDTMRRAADMPAHRVAFHLNDSEKECGSGVDRHAPLARGQIWKNGDGFIEFVAYAQRHHIPTIFERSARWGAAGRGADYAALTRALE